MTKPGKATQAKVGLIGKLRSAFCIGPTVKESAGPAIGVAASRPDETTSSQVLAESSWHDSSKLSGYQVSAVTFPSAASPFVPDLECQTTVAEYQRSQPFAAVPSSSADTTGPTCASYIDFSPEIVVEVEAKPDQALPSDSERINTTSQRTTASTSASRPAPRRSIRKTSFEVLMTAHAETAPAAKRLAARCNKTSSQRQQRQQSRTKGRLGLAVLCKVSTLVILGAAWWYLLALASSPNLPGCTTTAKLTQPFSSGAAAMSIEREDMRITWNCWLDELTLAAPVYLIAVSISALHVLWMCLWTRNPEQQRIGPGS
ncbi:hypothetical protein WJX84_008803 [Apatococcus fuscideae]|uniref:Uncharacterized protein n=1 Tax=Apatococcus fuscideae TaxID=2026836 RepID=A0AAW1TF62_9CHLO